MADTKANEPKNYVPDQTNLSYVPKITGAMSWDFSDGNILDYGCGSGVTAYNLILPQVEATNSQLYSFDISSEIVKLAEQTFPHPRIHYKAGTFPDSFPFADMKFDKIYSVNVFHFVKDIQTTLHYLTSILKPGGQLGFTATTINCPVMQLLENMSELPDLKAYLVDCKECLPEWSNYKNTSPDEFYRKILTESSGLKEVYFEFVNQEARFTTKGCLDIFLSMNPCLPENLLEDIREEYRRLVTAKLGAPIESPSIPFPVEYMCVVLEKPLHAT